MKTFLLLSLSLLPFSALAALPVGSSTQVVAGSEKVYGVKNFKVVMPGVLYRGGGEGGKNPLSDKALQSLCREGFRSAVYGYKTGWTGTKKVSCEGGQLIYTYRQWDKVSDAQEMHRELFGLIKNRGGAMYVHCWYGVHASGFLAATALMQFCGYSASQAVAYWDSNVPASIRYPKVQNAIRAFQVDPGMQLSAEEQATYCPR